jgi:hypothetical protein
VVDPDRGPRCYFWCDGKVKTRPASNKGALDIEPSAVVLKTTQRLKLRRLMTAVSSLSIQAIPQRARLHSGAFGALRGSTPT